MFIKDLDNPIVDDVLDILDILDELELMAYNYRHEDSDVFRDILFELDSHIVPQELLESIAEYEAYISNEVQNAYNVARNKFMYLYQQVKDLYQKYKSLLPEDFPKITNIDLDEHPSVFNHIRYLNNYKSTILMTVKLKQLSMNKYIDFEYTPKPKKSKPTKLASVIPIRKTTTGDSVN